MEVLSRLTPVQQRVAGTLLGLAAGDSNGGPTVMACMLAESLLSTRPEVNYVDIFSRYLDWHKQGKAFDTGDVCLAVFRLADMIPQYAPTVDSLHELSTRVHLMKKGMTGGCNPAHRCAPFAMASWIEDHALDQVVQQEARLTHMDSAAGEIAAKTAQAYRTAIREGPQVLGSHYVDESAHPRNALGLPHTGYAPDVWKSAQYFYHDALIRADHSATYDQIVRECLSESKRFAGPANYCPVLVGALLGARFGALSVFPLIEGHAHTQEEIQHIVDLSVRLAETW